MPALALYTVAELRAIEQAAAARLPPGALMQRAGQAGANAALDLLPFATGRARVLVLAGPGNNGGDALETAAHLAYAGAQVHILHYEGSAAPSAERAHALQRAQGSAARFDATDLPAIAGGEWNLVIDGLFGIGLARPLHGEFAALVATVNGLGCAILALDVPSGLDADTGAVVGPDGAAVHATHTVTFIADKPGLHTCDGRDHAGAVQLARLDIDAALMPPARLRINDTALFAHHAQRRRHNTHKGSHGDVAVIGGARGMAGAPLLAARMALMSGAGRVYACFVDDAPSHDAHYPELMCRPAADADVGRAALVAGPGLGNARSAHALLATAIGGDSALLLDADALNLLAADAALQTALAARSQRLGAPALLTPHPLEAARLLDVPVGRVQADRVAAARQLAARLGAVVVLKGSGTVIAAPDGQAAINPTGNPALATAGTGDVLSGLCGSLLAQGWPAWEAALAGVWLHGMAADVLVAEGAGPVGVTAGELIPAIRVALNRLVQHQRR